MLSWDAQINLMSGGKPSHQGQFDKEVCTTMKHLPVVQIKKKLKVRAAQKTQGFSCLLPFCRCTFLVSAWAKASVLLAVLRADRCVRLIWAEVKRACLQHGVGQALPGNKTCSTQAKVTGESQLTPAQHFPTCFHMDFLSGSASLLCALILYQIKTNKQQKNQKHIDLYTGYQLGLKTELSQWKQCVVLWSKCIFFMGI